MEPFQPFLIALLVLLVVVSLALLVQTRRWRRQRRREQAVIAAAALRMRSRLAAIGDPSIPPEPEPPYLPYAVLTAIARRVAVARAESTRRRVWRDASAALVVFAGLGLIAVFALPVAGQTTSGPSAAPTEVAVAATASPTEAATMPAMALAASPLPTRMEILLPTEVPTPTLPVTQTPRPAERVTTAARATPRPTPKPTAKPKATPKPVQPPEAGFTSSISGLTVNFTSTSKTYGAKASYLWSFGDGETSTAANPSHTYRDSGCYAVRLTVTTKGGSDPVSHQVCVE
jgi:hypothetical protein